MSDLNLLSTLFEQENFPFSIDRDDGSRMKRLGKPEEELNKWFSENDLNQVLPLIDHNFSFGDYEVFQNAASECSSDSGLSSEQSFSPSRTNNVDDFQFPKADLLENIHSSDSISRSTNLVKEESLSEFETVCSSVDNKSFDAFEFVQEEVVEYEEISVSSVSVASSDSNSQNDVYIISDDNDGITESDYLIESPFVISYPESRKLKLVNSRCKRLRTLTRSPTKKVQLRRKISEGYISEKDSSDDSDFLYPRLQLTPEEQKLAVKEGIRLPTHYPLTKAEERELKRIRRKIRNKISAQDSRRRRKVYVDSLEEKAKRTLEENANLRNRIKTLESQRISLTAQIRKLQASLARCSSQTAQPGTCLLVLIMSLALVLAPTLKNSALEGESNDDEGVSMSEDVSASNLNSVCTSSRNLLFSHKAHEGQCNIEEETKTISEQLQKMQLPDPSVLSSLLEMLKMNIGKSNVLLTDHDYFRPRKRQNCGNADYDSWVPSKLDKMSEQLLNNIIVEDHNKTGKAEVQEPVIIDLMSD